MVLENKLNIKDYTTLAKEEERLTKIRAIEIFDNDLFFDLDEIGTYKNLSKIHYHLFQDIYHFSGKIRTENISKNGFRFASVLYLENALLNISEMPQSNFNQIIEKYVEMNIAHPFREGNGRSIRIWLEFILKKELKKVIDWSKVDKNDYLLAIERSPIKDTEIKSILKKALTSDIYNRELYMKGIEQSYLYEGYNTYKINNIIKNK